MARLQGIAKVLANWSWKTSGNYNRKRIFPRKNDVLGKIIRESDLRPGKRPLFAPETTDRRR